VVMVLFSDAAFTADASLMGLPGADVSIFDGQGLAPNTTRDKRRCCFTTHTNAQSPPPPRLPLVVSCKHLQNLLRLSRYSAQ
jgi:hypothetical protein